MAVTLSVMERRIDLSNVDLDAAAEAIADRRTHWLALGLNPHPITWMEIDSLRPATTERSEVTRPRWLRLRLEGPGGASYAEFVLYAGGWADASYYGPDEKIRDEYVEVDGVEDFAQLLDRVVPRLTDFSQLPDRVEPPDQAATGLAQTIGLTLLLPPVTRDGSAGGSRVPPSSTRLEGAAPGSKVAAWCSSRARRLVLPDVPLLALSIPDQCCRRVS